MADTQVVSVWLGRGMYLACAAVLLFWALVPLQFTPSVIPRPDLTLCLTFAIVLRRPEYAPFWLVALVFFVDDILLERPMGLWTGLVVLACEFIRSQEYRFRETIFPVEWAFVGAIMFLTLLANRLMLALVFVPLPRFGLEALHYFVTVLVYPGVVFFCYFVLRVRKVTPDVAIRFGHRL
jgi:rod shape-determining protein MreD